MERTIGLDVHAASTTVAVVNATGKRLGSKVLETNGRALVEHLKGIAGQLSSNHAKTFRPMAPMSRPRHPPRRDRR